MPAVNDVGEPCAGEPHARIDAAGAGNGATLATVIGESTTDRETGGRQAPSPTVRNRNRASSRLYMRSVGRGATQPIPRFNDGSDIPGAWMSSGEVVWSSKTGHRC
jgi:hypothetical protein